MEKLCLDAVNLIIGMTKTCPRMSLEDILISQWMVDNWKAKENSVSFMDYGGRSSFGANQLQRMTTYTVKNGNQISCLTVA